jgi:hypothetical protein
LYHANALNKQIQNGRGQQEARKRGAGLAWAAEGSRKPGREALERVLGFLMGLGLAWAAEGTKSTTSRLKN